MPRVGLYLANGGHLPTLSDILSINCVEVGGMLLSNVRVSFFTALSVEFAFFFNSSIQFNREPCGRLATLQ